MGELFSLLFAKVAAVVKWFSDLFVAVFVALYAMFKDLISWAFDSIMDLLVSAVQSVDVSSLTPYLSGAGNLPAQLLDILALLGVGTAISIIAAAILIRLGLQLIPFTRLGS